MLAVSSLFCDYEFRLLKKDRPLKETTGVAVLPGLYMILVVDWLSPHHIPYWLSCPDVYIRPHAGISPVHSSLQREGLALA